MAVDEPLLRAECDHPVDQRPASGIVHTLDKAGVRPEIQGLAVRAVHDDSLPHRWIVRPLGIGHERWVDTGARSGKIMHCDQPFHQPFVLVGQGGVGGAHAGVLRVATSRRDLAG